MKLEGFSNSSPNRSAVESSCSDMGGSLSNEIQAHCNIVWTVVPEHRGIGSMRAIIAGAGFDPQGALPAQFAAENTIGRVLKLDMLYYQRNTAFQCERTN